MRISFYLQRDDDDDDDDGRGGIGTIAKFHPFHLHAQPTLMNAVCCTAIVY